MKTTSYLLLAFVVFLAISSCTKKTPANPDNPGTTGTTGSTGQVRTTPAPGIYFAGGRILDFDKNFYQATIWRNNAPTTFSETSSNGLAITAQDTDIYVAGYELSTACYWKNGKIVKLTELPEGRAEARAIVVQGGDIHIAGVSISKNGGFYWKNGTVTMLTSPGVGINVAGMVIKGTDVYICGNYTLSNFTTVPCYWKNGVITELDKSNAFSNMPNGIAVADNGDVNVVGYQFGTAVPVKRSGNNTPTLWKNGVASALPISPAGGIAKAITIKGTDVYIAGNTESAPGTGTGAVYWKNNVPIYINNNSTIGTAIFVTGDEVHVTGAKKLDQFGIAAASWNTSVIYGQSLNSVFNGVYVVK
jgi:hypothetical protein